MGSLRTLNTAEITDDTTYLNVGFTCSLAHLAPPAGGASPTSTAAGLIDNNLASGVKNGYTFSFGTCNTVTAGGNTIVVDYQLKAGPASVGSSSTQPVLQRPAWPAATRSSQRLDQGLPCGP